MIAAITSAILATTPAYVSRPVAQSYAIIIHKEAKRRGVDWVLVVALIARENTGWDPKAVNAKTEATGLMQVMPVHFLGKWDATDPKLNLRFGIKLLAKYIAQCGGNEDHGLALFVGYGRCMDTSSAARVRATMVRLLPFAGRCAS